MNLRCNLFGHQHSGKGLGGWNHECKRCHIMYDNKWRDTFWESSTWEGIKILFNITVVVVVLFGAFSLLITGTGMASCNQYRDMGVETIYKFWVGCMANHEKFGWVPVEEYFRTINLNIP